MDRSWIIGLAAFALGAASSAGALTAFPRESAKEKPKPDTKEGHDDGDALKRANDSLTEQLQECDRRLADLGERDHARPTASAAPVAEERDAGRGFRRRDRGEPSKEDWERMAETGQLRVRIPCIRDTPWQPSQRAVDRLGLAPQDTETLKEAYAASNKRMAEQIRPICAKALGSADAAEKVGTVACMDVIQNTARKSNADAMKQSLTRAAEVQAGKRPAPKAGDEVAPVEQLALVLATENKTFEKDLAQKLGPDEAKRLAWAPELCTERRTLRASDEDVRGRDR